MIDHRLDLFLFFILAARTKPFQPLACAASATRRVSIHAPTARHSNSMVVSTRSTPARKRASRQLQKRRRQKKSSNLRKKGPSRRPEERLGKEEKSPCTKKVCKDAQKNEKSIDPKEGENSKGKNTQAFDYKEKKTPAKKTPVKGGATKLKGKENIGERSADTELFNAWNYTVEDTLRYYQVDVGSGLTDKEAEDRLQRFGPNELDKEEGATLWELFLEQFDDPLVKILLAAAVISTVTAILEKDNWREHTFGIGDFVEPLVILTILILNAIVGVWQEHNAENALEALKELTPTTARVWRNGKLDNDFLASGLVPGDVVEIKVGDMVPADCRVLQLKTVTVGIEQMSLTGESATVRKETSFINGTNPEIQLKTNMVFAGTVCSNGHMVGVVQSTGMRTEIGKVQAAVQGAAKENEDEKTPLGEKLDDFSDQLMYLIGLVCALVWLLKYNEWLYVDGKFTFNGKSCLENFQVAVALAVAAIPEGLPAVITTCLALGTRQMAKRNAIVRKLPSVETLGCTTVICSDKTGTLTTNMMSVRKVITMYSKTKVKEYSVGGSTYDPTDGEISPSYDGEDAAFECMCPNKCSVQWCQTCLQRWSIRPRGTTNRSRLICVGREGWSG